MPVVPPMRVFNHGCGAVCRLPVQSLSANLASTVLRNPTKHSVMSFVGTTLTEEGDEGQKTIDSVGIQTLDTVNFCVRNSGGNTNEHTDASNV